MQPDGSSPVDLDSIQQLSGRIMTVVRAVASSPAFSQLVAQHPLHTHPLPTAVHLPLFMAAVFDVCMGLATIYQPNWDHEEDRDAWLTVPGLPDADSYKLLSPTEVAELPGGLPLHWVQDQLTGRIPAGRAEYAGGVNLPATIVSAAFAATPFHIEDGCLGALNLLVEGEGKLWFFIPERHSLAFRYVTRPAARIPLDCPVLSSGHRVQVLCREQRCSGPHDGDI